MDVEARMDFHSNPQAPRKRLYTVRPLDRQISPLLFPASITTLDLMQCKICL